MRLIPQSDTSATLNPLYFRNFGSAKNSRFRPSAHRMQMPFFPCSFASRIHSESSSEEPSSPASSEPPAPSEPELTPEQRLALYRSEVLQLLNTGRTVPFSAPASALSDAAQTRAEELQQTGRLSHKRPNGEDYTSLLPGSNLPGFVSKELYASGQATPAEFVSHLKTRRSGVDWETVLDTQYTQIGIGYAVDADGVPYWELLLLNG